MELREQVRRTGVNGIGVLVGDLDAELLLDGHDDLDGIEAVKTEVVGEVSGGLDLGLGSVWFVGSFGLICTYVLAVVDLDAS